MAVKKERILATATRLFSERGFARTSTALLAQEAGVAEGTIFRHFKNKDDIFLELIHRLCERITADVYKYLEVCTPETGIEQICAVMRACYVFARNNNTEFSLVFRDAPGHYCEPEAEPYGQFRYIIQLLQEHFTKGIENGKVDGSIRQDIVAADMSPLLAGALVGVMRSVNLGFLENTDQMLPPLLRSVRDMLMPQEMRDK